MVRIKIAMALILGLICAQACGNLAIAQQGSPSNVKQPTFVQKLHKRIRSYDSKKQSLVENLLDLAFEYQLPTGLEYVSRDMVQRPIPLHVENKSLASLVVSLVAAARDGVKVDLSQGLVDVYNPEARANPKNVLNTVVARFQLKEVGPEFAAFYVAGSLQAIYQPGSAFGGSFPGKPFGRGNLNFDLRNRPAYDILNRICAQSGSYLWAVFVPPADLTKFSPNMWHLYHLDPAFKDLVRENLEELFPRTKHP